MIRDFKWDWMIQLILCTSICLGISTAKAECQAPQKVQATLAEFDQWVTEYGRNFGIDKAKGDALSDDTLFCADLIKTEIFENLDLDRYPILNQLIDSKLSDYPEAIVQIEVELESRWHQYYWPYVVAGLDRSRDHRLYSGIGGAIAGFALAGLNPVAGSARLIKYLRAVAVSTGLGAVATSKGDELAGAFSDKKIIPPQPSLFFKAVAAGEQSARDGDLSNDIKSFISAGIGAETGLFVAAKASKLVLKAGSKFSGPFVIATSLITMYLTDVAVDWAYKKWRISDLKAQLVAQAALFWDISDNNSLELLKAEKKVIELTRNLEAIYAMPAWEAYQKYQLELDLIGQKNFPNADARALAFQTSEQTFDEAFYNALKDMDATGLPDARRRCVYQLLGGMDPCTAETNIPVVFGSDPESMTFAQNALFCFGRDCRINKVSAEQIPGAYREYFSEANREQRELLAKELVHGEVVQNSEHLLLQVLSLLETKQNRYTDGIRERLRQEVDFRLKKVLMVKQISEEILR